MRSVLLLLAVALVGAVSSVAFVALTNTGAPGLYAALFVAGVIGLCLSAWDDHRQRRYQPHR